MLYAATLGGGVFKSTDAGAAWTAMNGGLTYQFSQRTARDAASQHLVDHYWKIDVRKGSTKSASTAAAEIKPSRNPTIARVLLKL
jgi:hypothetical protein